MPKKSNKATDADYLEFVEWEAKPHHLLSEDEPKSYDEMAEKLGVTRKTLYEWRKLEGHWDRVSKCYNKYHKAKLLNIRDALYNRANGVTVETTNNKGEIIYANKDKYEGTFQNGKKHGKGIYHYTTGGKYKGEWAHDKKQGYGVI